MDNIRVPKLSVLDSPPLMELSGTTYALSIVSDVTHLLRSTVFCGTPLDSTSKEHNTRSEKIIVKFFSPASTELVEHWLTILPQFSSSKLPCCKWLEHGKLANPLFPEEGPVHYIARNRYDGISVLDFSRVARSQGHSYVYESLLDYYIETISMLKRLHATDDTSPGVVHRDIKPSNIILLDSEESSVTIIDFDIACLVGETSAFATNRSYHGTNVYLAPEHFFPEKAPTSVHPSCDIYALGVVFYETLEGCWPYFVPPKHLHDYKFWSSLFSRRTIRKPRKIDQALKPLIMGMLDFDWRARPTATEVEAYLLAYRAELSDAALSRCCYHSNTSPDPNPTPLPL